MLVLNVTDIHVTIHRIVRHDGTLKGVISVQLRDNDDTVTRHVGQLGGDLNVDGIGAVIGVKWIRRARKGIHG